MPNWGFSIGIYIANEFDVCQLAWAIGESDDMFRFLKDLTRPSSIIYCNWFLIFFLW
jgi:hypothetical protein